jgi:hypothetical protein
MKVQMTIVLTLYLQSVPKLGLGNEEKVVLPGFGGE